MLELVLSVILMCLLRRARFIIGREYYGRLTFSKDVFKKNPATRVKKLKSLKE